MKSLSYIEHLDNVFYKKKEIMYLEDGSDSIRGIRGRG